MILKFLWRSKRPRRPNKILKKKTVGRPMPLNFKNGCEAVVITRVLFWRKSRQKGQWDSAESPEIDPHKNIK